MMRVNVKLTTGKKFDRAGFIKTLKQMSFGFYQFKVEKPELSN